MKEYFEKKTISWAMYDWANSAFATTVIAGFFPIFFREFWSVDAESVETTFRLGVASSISSLIIVILAPIIGAIADRAGAKKKLLVAFAFVGILSTFCLYLVSYGYWQLAIVLYVVGSLGFSGANVLYDALLLEVASGNDRIHSVSGFGFALGYLGGGILFAINVFMVLKPEFFGLADAGEAVRYSFVSVAVWWAIFSIPLIVFVKETPSKQSQGALNSVSVGLRQLRDTVRDIRTKRTIVIFLFAYWFYIDGVDTVFRMSVDYGLSIGLDANDLISALLMVQFVGFPAAIIFGKLGQRVGPRTGIYIGILVYVVATIWAYFIQSGAEFFVLAAMIGMVQGGIQALSRSLYGQMIPPERAGEYYGFYNMISKSAAVIGPFLVGWTAAMFGARNSILSVIVLFGLGAILLYYVKSPQSASE
ncbi:MAG: MFS transporter [Acidiferrobacterales bacterium]|nr:MFS transporter [Acidiferrobacterales bacterium]